MRRVATVVILAFLLTLTGCTRPTPSSPQDASRPLTVAAAADLQSAFAEIGRKFEERTGQKVVFTFGSSGNLAKQIENGAPIDVFAAANVEYVEGLKNKGLVIPETVQLYAVGRIVLARNKAAEVDVRTLAGLLDPRVKKIAIANPDHAPYGLAAKQALISAGVWDRIQPKLVLGENIRQTLQFVQTGNAEAGIVALSIAGAPEISYTLIDDRLHSPLKQALAVVKSTPDEKSAREFVALVRGPEGRQMMRKYGFALPEEK